MLVRCDALIPTLLDALFLDPEHVRTNMHETLRAGIQCDGVQCFLQLALFEPGKQLLEQHPEALDALRALVNGAGLTEEARLLASSALAAVEGPLPNRFPAPTPNDEKHVMISCTRPSVFSYSARTEHFVCYPDQWNVQSTIRRLVTSLQHRGYVVWFGMSSSCIHASHIRPHLRGMCRSRVYEGIGGRCVSSHRQLLPGHSSDSTLILCSQDEQRHRQRSMHAVRCLRSLQRVSKYILRSPDFSFPDCD